MTRNIKLKSILIIIFCIFEANAKAEDSVKNTRSFNDLSYIPEKGNTFTSAEFEYEIVKSTLSKNYDNETTTKALAITAEHGILTNLSIGFNASNIFSDTLETTYLNNSIPSQSSNSKGMTDPTFFGRFRALEQSNNNINLDLSVSVSPELIKNKPDNEGKGGTDAGLSIGLSRAYYNFQWLVNLSLNNLGEKITKNKTGDDTKIKARTSFDLSLNYQYKLNEKNYFSFGAGWFNVPTQDISQGTTTSKLDSNYGFKLGIMEDYIFVPEKFGMYIKSEYAHSGDRIYSTSTIKDTYKVTDIDAISIIFGIKYQF